MLGTTSGSQSSGSGALSHVYIQHPPLRCSIPRSRGLFYDDGNKLLLSPTSDQVFVWKTSPLSPQDAPSVDSIDEGPLLSIRFSLDGKVVAIQRSNHEIQFRNRETGETFSQKCKTDSESILGFFWTDCPTCNVVFVKTSGMDMFFYEPELKTLRLVETKKLNVSWYVYTHESRMVLLASGMQCKAISGFQFSSGGVIRLPRFDMTMAKAEANQKPVLAEEDVHIVTIYGRIYCLQVDRVVMLLHFYRFYRDAVVPQCTLPIFSSKIAVSVIDNVLLVHQVDAKVVILYDIFSDSRAPISAPLPLLLRGIRKANASTRSIGKDAAHLETKETIDQETVVYGPGWSFLVPDLICDTVHGNLWRIHLDLETIAASNSEAASVLEFLQRRKLEPSKAKHLCLEITRTLILERRPVPIVSKAIDVLVFSYSLATKMGVTLQKKPVEGEKTSTSNTVADLKGNRSSTGSDSEESLNPELSSQSQTNGTEQHQECQVSCAAVSPDEIYSLIFSVIEEEMAGEPSFLVSILIEYFRSAASDKCLNMSLQLFHDMNFLPPSSAALEKLKVHPKLYVMAIQLLGRSDRYAELWSLVTHKILEPSKDVAMQLLESGRENRETRKMGMEMLRQLGLHHDYVVLLVQDGYYLEALRYARRNKVNSIQPSLFLEAAYASNNSQHVAAVLRFLTDFIPGFNTTSDHTTYCRILNDMKSSPSVAAA